MKPRLKNEPIHGGAFPEVSISSGLDIPVLARGNSKMVGLIGSRKELTGLSIPGTRHYDGASFALRAEDFPFEELDGFLPRMARRKVVPEIMELIPSSSWFASLANLLVGSSWNALRDISISRAGACEECGSSQSLEAHEVWSYDHERLTQELMGIEALCRLCHGTRHLGRANVIGNFEATFRRLCLINRLMPHQEIAYRQMVFDLWEARSTVRWRLDLSLVLEHDHDGLFLKGGVEYAGGDWLVQPTTASRSEMSVEIAGADIATDGRRLVLVKKGTGPT